MLCRLTHNSFVILEIHTQNRRLLWDQTKTVTPWSWDWRTPLLHVGSFLRAAVKIWYWPEWWIMTTQERKVTWPKRLTFIRAPVFLHVLQNTNIKKKSAHVEDERRLLSVRCCSCSAPITSAVNGDPQRIVIIPRSGAIIYGSTSCPPSPRQTGFTILSYTISDLSLCSSARHSVWPFYHLNGAERFKKGA